MSQMSQSLQEFDEEEQMALEAVKMSSLRKRINAKGWSNHMEDIMKSWGEKAAGNREMHDAAATKWKKFSDRIYIPVIFLSTIAGVTNFGAASVEDNEYWMYAIGVINIFSAFIASLMKYYRPDEKQQAHRFIARNFGSYYRQMTLELGMSREDRMGPDELVKFAKNEYDRLLKDAPSLPGDVVEDFKRKHKTEDNLPDVALTNFEIKVYGRNEETVL